MNKISVAELDELRDRTPAYALVDELPSWDDIKILTAQLARPPLLDDEPVGTEVVIGPNAQKPLRLEIPLLVSDMSFGALSEPAKRVLARGAELAGAGAAPILFRDNISVPTIAVLSGVRYGGVA